jgi:2-polyprenyl-3-methyl-5-hydroxy-6-metoxy-1,4-benzoquinol methylase
MADHKVAVGAPLLTRGTSKPIPAAGETSRGTREIRTATSTSGLPFEPEPMFWGSLRNEGILADNRGFRIGVLIVTDNAVTTISKVLKRITPEVWNNVEEIAVFDDASHDATYELAVGLKTLSDSHKLEVVRHPKNLGYGGNQKAGFRYFLDKGLDVVVLLHGDGKYAPEILSHLYHPIIAGEADAVLGSRMMSTYGRPLKSGMPLYKYLGNQLLSAFQNRALGMTLTEFHSGYRAYNLHALAKIDFNHMTDGYHFDTEMIIKLNHQHYTIKEVAIPTYDSAELRHAKGLTYALKVFQAVRRYKKTAWSSTCYPEFQEYFVHYPIKQSKYSSHYYAQLMIGRNHEVLDISCGEGFFAAEIVKQENRVTGVDVLPDVLERSPLSDYISTDLNNGLDRVAKRLNGKRFDRILLLDILEHLYNPEDILRQCHKLVQEDGELIVSLPNVANLSMRLMLLFGHFDYTDRGILDRTHLHWYTRKTARQLLINTGYRVVSEKSTVIPIALALGISPRGILFNFMNGVLGVLTLMMPGLLGYQIMLVARRERPGVVHSCKAGSQ